MGQSALHCRLDAFGTNGNQLTLLRVWPLTGRTHQIRVHMQLLGCPLVADHKYGQREQLRSQRRWCPRLFLHCSRVSLRDLRGNEFDASQELPDDLRAAVSKLRRIELASSTAAAAVDRVLW